MQRPTHWAMATLGDLVDVYDFARVPLNKRQRIRFQGPFPYYGANGVVDWVEDYIFDGTFILIAEDGGHYADPTRAVAVKVDGRFWVNNHAHVVRARDGIDSAYLAYALRTVDWMEHVSGSTRLKLTQANLRSLPVPVTSSAEQVRLARRLDDALAGAESGAESLARAQALIQNFRVAVTAAALSGEVTRQWREDIGAPDWEEVRLGDQIEALAYGSSAKSSKSGTTPVLRMGNIQGGKLDWTDLAYTSDEREIEKYRLERGDVLFNRTNSAELVGKTALYDSDRPAIYAGYLIKITCGAGLSPAFLTYVLNGSDARDYFSSVRSDGVNQSNINAAKLADLRFKCPSLAEQQEIVRRLEQKLAWADEMHNHISASEALLARLRIGVVAKGFRGELTSSEPGDEHVDVLLARLASETAEARTARLNADKLSLIKRSGTSSTVGGQRAMRYGEVKADYLREKLVMLGGEASAANLWAESQLAIEDFYKQLRNEVVAGRVREGREKGWLVATDAA